MNSSYNSCYHCGDRVTASDNIHYDYQNNRYDFCCYGCLSIFKTLCQLGHFDYYLKRKETSSRPPQEIFQDIINEHDAGNIQPVSTKDKTAYHNAGTHNSDPFSFIRNVSFRDDYIEKIKLYDDPDVAVHYISELTVATADNRDKDDNSTANRFASAKFDLYDMTCTACAWLIEKSLSRTDGIEKVELSYQQQSLQITWQPEKLSLSQIVLLIQKIGYRALPVKKHQTNQNYFQQRKKQLLKHIGITGVFAMQIMVVSVAMYAGDFQGMEANFRLLMQKAALLLSLPVILYSAQPFFLSAYRALKNRSVNMDVPVSIAIVLGFCASVYHTILNSSMLSRLPVLQTAEDLLLKDVYFDSIAMLILFLLLGRFFEARASSQAVNAVNRLTQQMPLTCEKFIIDNKDSNPMVLNDWLSGNLKTEKLAAGHLKTGDLILLKSGEVSPADGIVTEGNSLFNFSVVTGESREVSVSPGSEILAGAVNTNDVVVLKCTKVGNDSTLHQIKSLAESSQMQKPTLNRHVDIIARYFTLGLLVVASLTAYYWFQKDQNQWIEITLATLIITCPCALSLATPVSITAAISRFLQQGALLRNVEVLQVLPKIKNVIFDKTGTLTQGTLKLLHFQNFSRENDKNVLQLIQQIESGASHPIAGAFDHIEPDKSKTDKSEVVSLSQSNNGVRCEINGQSYYFGNLNFIRENTSVPLENLSEEINFALPGNNPVLQNDTAIAGLSYLTDDEQLLAMCVFSDGLKPQAAELVRYFNDYGFRTILLSGDFNKAVRHMATKLHFAAFAAEQMPDDKRRYIQEMQQAGHKVLMIGDGINDAPVLALADCSLAVKNAAHYAIAEADIVLLRDDIGSIRSILQTAKKTHKIILQNLRWALAYNIFTVPAAAAGLIHPLVAAIGMSASSLLVTLNASRILLPAKQQKPVLQADTKQAAAVNQ